MIERARELLHQEDVEAFNLWRLEHDAIALELGGEDLSGLDLSGAFLMGAQLEGANLSHARLHHVLLCGARLVGADFHNADLTDACFGPPSLISSTLLDSPLGDLLLRGADCSGASFEVATLTHASFKECDVSGADFTRANHGDADFRRAITRGAIMPDAQSTLAQRAWGSLKGLTFEHKRAYIQSLYVVACADGDFDESEQAFLFSMASHMELTPEEFEGCVPRAGMRLEEVELQAPPQPEARVQWLRNIIMMIAADGVLAPKEYESCLFFAEKLGFPVEAVDAALSALSLR